MISDWHENKYRVGARAIGRLPSTIEGLQSFVVLVTADYNLEEMKFYTGNVHRVFVGQNNSMYEQHLTILNFNFEIFLDL